MKRFNVKTGLLTCVFLAATAGVSFADNDETLGEKAGEAVRDTKKAAKKTARAIDDKACKMVNGKLECAAKSVKNKAKNAVDEVDDKLKD